MLHSRSFFLHRLIILSGRVRYHLGLGPSYILQEHCRSFALFSTLFSSNTSCLLSFDIPSFDRASNFDIDHFISYNQFTFLFTRNDRRYGPTRLWAYSALFATGCYQRIIERIWKLFRTWRRAFSIIPCTNRERPSSTATTFR
jgi:hypothetical protein